MRERQWWQIWIKRGPPPAVAAEMPAWIYSRGLYRNLLEVLFPHRWLAKHAGSGYSVSSGVASVGLDGSLVSVDAQTGDDAREGGSKRRRAGKGGRNLARQSDQTEAHPSIRGEKARSKNAKVRKD